MPSDHHYVSKGFIKYWQPSYMPSLANSNRSNGGVYVYNTTNGYLSKKNNLQKVFSAPGLNDPNVEAKISALIEQPLGNLRNFNPYHKGLTRSSLNWRQERAIILLTLLQSARLPGKAQPLINQILSQDQSQIDQLAMLHKQTHSYMGVSLNEGINVFLNELGFFVFPIFDFRNHSKVLRATQTEHLWGIAVPIRPHFMFISVSTLFADTNWMHQNMHIFQTYSVGLQSKELIVPPTLRTGGSMKSGGVVSNCSLDLAITTLRKQVKAADALVASYFQLAQLLNSVSFQHLPGGKP